MDEPIIRKLEKKDLWNGFLSTLDILRETSSIGKKEAEKIFEKIDADQDHIILVAEIDGRIVGTATLLIESKFIHNGGIVGHIEDVAVDKNHQGKEIGKKIIEYLLEYAKNRECYKTILDCTDEVRPFYEKIGFKNYACALRFDYD